MIDFYLTVSLFNVQTYCIFTNSVVKYAREAIADVQPWGDMRDDTEDTTDVGYFGCGIP